MSTVANLETVHNRLGSIRSKIRALYLQEGIAQVLLRIAAFMAVTFVLDFLLILPREVRLVFLLGGGAWVAWTIIKKVLYRGLVPISDDDLALFVERNYPELQERLISAIQFSRSLGDEKKFNSPELVDAIIADAADAAGSLDFGRVLVRKHVGKMLAWTFVVAMVIAGLGFGFQEYFGIYVQRAFGMDTRWPQRIRMQVLDFENNRRIVARGDDLVLAVQAEIVRPGASLPEKAYIHYQFDSGEHGREQMTPMGNGSFKFEFHSVTGPFKFQVQGGDDTTDDYFIITKNPPTLEEINVWYEYPPYLGKTNTPLNQPEVSGNVKAPLHTVVKFMARVGESLNGAELALGKGSNQTKLDLVVEHDADGLPRKVRGEFEVVEGIGEYEIILRALNQLENRDPIRFMVKGMMDQSPEITVNDPVGTEYISPLCVRPYDLVVKDDFGVAEVGFKFKITGHKEVDWTYRAFKPGDNGGADYGQTVGRIQTIYDPGFDVTEFEVKPGDFIHVRFVAKDYKNVGQRRVTETKEYRFEVIPITELQKRLEQDIEKIKTELERTVRSQDRLYDQIERFMTTRGFTTKDRLVSTEAGEVREASLEQNSITTKIDRAKREIERVRRRGVYNKVFEEAAAKELVNAETVLGSLIGQKGASPVAAALLHSASKARSAANRHEAFRSAQDMEAEVLKGLKDAIRYLQRWSTYQEVVRMARAIYEAWLQERGRMKSATWCPACRMHTPDKNKCERCGKTKE